MLTECTVTLSLPLQQLLNVAYYDGVESPLFLSFVAKINHPQIIAEHVLVDNLLSELLSYCPISLIKVLHEKYNHIRSAFKNIKLWKELLESIDEREGFDTLIAYLNSIGIKCPESINPYRHLSLKVDVARLDPIVTLPLQCEADFYQHMFRETCLIEINKLDIRNRLLGMLNRQFPIRLFDPAFRDLMYISDDKELAARVSSSDQLASMCISESLDRGELHWVKNLSVDCLLDCVEKRNPRATRGVNIIELALENRQHVLISKLYEVGLLSKGIQLSSERKRMSYIQLIGRSISGLDHCLTPGYAQMLSLLYRTLPLQVVFNIAINSKLPVWRHAFHYAVGHRDAIHIKFHGGRRGVTLDRSLVFLHHSGQLERLVLFCLDEIQQSTLQNDFSEIARRHLARSIYAGHVKVIKRASETLILLNDRPFDISSIQQIRMRSFKAIFVMIDGVPSSTSMPNIFYDELALYLKTALKTYHIDSPTDLELKKLAIIIIHEQFITLPSLSSFLKAFEMSKTPESKKEEATAADIARPSLYC